MFVQPKEPLPTVRSTTIAPPPRTGPLFRGWGPRLFVGALALGALGLATSPTVAAPTAVASLGTGSTCSISDRDAAVIYASIPEWPAFALAQGARGDVTLEIALNETARIEAISIRKSSGSAALDGEAIRVARTTSFAPKLVDCAGHAGTYAFEVVFE